MSISHRSRLVMLWLLGSALLVTLLYHGAQANLRAALTETLRSHLLLALDESHFSSAQNRVNDNAALQRIGRDINRALLGVVRPDPWSLCRDCRVELRSIDGVTVAAAQHGSSPPVRMRFGLPRNQVEREVELALGCSLNWLAALLVASLLGALFLAIARVLPPPLSRRHRRWINRLLGEGYSGQRAFELVSGFDAAQLRLNRAQRRCLALLHEPEAGNFEGAMAVASDARVAALSPADVDWLVLGLARAPQDLDAALQLATARGPEVVVDLPRATLAIRGLPLEVGATPFFYYAWYALARLEGEGWVANPAANRPHREAGQALAQLMSRYGGHGRAINDLEENGLRARTLDQNRSKLKDDLVAALGEELAAPYLFESSRDGEGGQTRYRLRVAAAQLRVLD